MEWNDFLERVINDGIQGAKDDYQREDQKHKLDGAITGFNACRGCNPEELRDLLAQARQKVTEIRGGGNTEDIWYWICYEAEIEWVCNVCSAAGAGIVPVTARGLIKANDILGAQNPV